MTIMMTKRTTMVARNYLPHQIMLRVIVNNHTMRNKPTTTMSNPNQYFMTLHRKRIKRRERRKRMKRRKRKIMLMMMMQILHTNQGWTC